MEAVPFQRVTPVLKCTVFFLFIFITKVLTSRTQDIQVDRPGVQQSKTPHYVRTFTKYHHLRTAPPNNVHDNGVQREHKDSKVHKRSIGSDEFINGDAGFAAQSMRDLAYNKQAISNNNDVSRNGVSKGKVYDDKVIVKTKDPLPTAASTISCVYERASPVGNHMASQDEDNNAQYMVDNDNFGIGTISKSVVNGEAVLVEQCTDPKANCFTLWQEGADGKGIVLGQGCWRSSQVNTGQASCGFCRVTSRLKPIKFCCCTESYCNANYTSIPLEVLPVFASSTAQSVQTWYLSVFCALLGVTLLCVALLYRPRQRGQVHGHGKDVMGTGPDALATGLSCVDNLVLIEHIGQGKFGSVWRGTLGSNPVAVKMYSNNTAWQRESEIYSIPNLAHSNLLKYYGRSSRLASRVIVLELCEETLRQRLVRAEVSWTELAALAHGAARALAHLHTPVVNKPCIVHRDVNSTNILVTADGTAKLADLGLAQLPTAGTSNNITEAGTIRYLPPEALEGALDLCGARAALCAVDVYSLGLVLWELAWRLGPRAPPAQLPYQQQGARETPSLSLMQNIVCRNKSRPELPRHRIPESRAFKILCDTCEESWDHDAEARLTAVCVEERMAELKQLLQAQPPVIHDNNLHPHSTDSNPPPEQDKNSNCTSSQACDVTTPLLYPQHIGRNPIIERNTHNYTPSNLPLIHKSLKDVTIPIQTLEHSKQNLEDCLSVARVTSRPIIQSENSLEVRSYQRPIEYVQNDVSRQEIEIRPKQTNLNSENIPKPKWGIKSFFEKKLNKNKLETEVKLVPDNLVQQNGKTKISIVNEKQNNVSFDRPANLTISQEPFFEVPCTLSPPNRTLSPTMMLESELNRENRVFATKELPTNDNEKTQNQIFAVIVPKAKPTDYNILEMRKNRGSSESLNKSIRASLSSQYFKSGNSESDDSTNKKCLSVNHITSSNNSNSGRSSRASINLELQYLDQQYSDNSPYELNSDSSEDENLMLLSENGGAIITMQAIPKLEDRKKYQNDILKETSQPKGFGFNKYQNKYSNFDNEVSDPNDKENLVYSGDNPVYFAALNGDIATSDLKITESPKSPKPCIKNLAIKRQSSLEQVSDIFVSSGDLNLLNVAGRVKTPGDIPVSVRKARRDRALQKGRASESNRLSLYDDRMMFGNSL